MISVNCQFSTDFGRCSCPKVKRSLFGIGPRICVEYPAPKFMSKCEHKLEFIRTPPTGGSSVRKP